ncbi:MAG: PKD domain-containing protein [Cryomorphaceae bacterium]|nr:PKD domain-containing protein [Flavobacteriales bacterium]
MEQKFNSFDNQIKETYEGHEMPYDSSSWDNLSSKLDAMAPAPVTYFTALTTGLVAVGIIFLSLLFILSGKNHTPDQTADDTANTEITTSTNENDVAGTSKTDGSAADTADAQNEPNDHLTSAAKKVDEGSERGAENVITTQQEVESSTTASQAKKTEGENRTLQDGDETTSISSDIASAAASVKATENSASETAANKADKPNVITGEKTITSTESSNNKIVRTSCTGITINFDASQDYGRDAKYLWNFGDGFFSNESNPSHTFNKPGTFDVSLSVTSHTSGQITSNVVQAMIEVIEAPRARMSVHIPSPSEIEVENISIGDDSAEWMIDSEARKAGTVAKLPFAADTQNEIKLVALNKSGCADTLTKHLNFKEIADALSVDADVDTPFYPEAESGVTFSKLYIFEASSGKKVFHSFDGSGWNPTEMGEGIEYTFLAVAKEKDRTEVYRGTVVRK